MSHAHDHDGLDPESGDRRVSIAIWANALLTIGQIVGGVFSGSLARPLPIMRRLILSMAMACSFLSERRVSVSDSQRAERCSVRKMAMLALGA